MGKLSDFIECGVERMGYPRAVLESHIKPLRKAGLITTGGRGTAAPDITAYDCARIVLSLMMGSPTYAVDVVKIYGDLRSCYNKGAGLAPLNLQSDHSLLDMIAAIFQSEADGTLINNLTMIFTKEDFISEKDKTSNNTESEYGHYSSFSLRMSSEIAFVNFSCVINSAHVDDLIIRYLPKHDFAPIDERNKAISEQPPMPPIKSPGIITYTADAGPDVVDAVGTFLRKTSTSP